ncbi:MAG: hypothetical protein EWM50_06375 [Gottschalkiaceae bacterium]|nr:MAG: hypothetical protein EWM50_06375 [Gottschalkiaceae bacterium]
MNINKVEELFRDLWELYGKSIEIDRNAKLTDNDLLIDEFFFVVLGGYGISYELNRSGLNILKSKGLISSHLYTDDKVKEVEVFIREEFSLKQFEPKTKSNELRKYRFIESKPAIVASAGNWIFNECNWNLNEWLDINDQDSRSKLCKCPGIGMKSASWFLRNIGYNEDYAVFDVHILRFISKIGIDVPNVITEKVYINLENILRAICSRIDVTLGKMDYLLWVLGRSGYLDYVRCN